MPFATNNDVNIYYEVHGDGTPLILAHGFTGTIDYWTGYAFVDLLKDDFKVILFDARGHGKSDKPHDPNQYSDTTMANDVIAVMDDLGIQKAHYWGYSMGGFVAFAVAKDHPERLNSFIVGGVSPYFDRTNAPGLVVFRNIFQLGMDSGADAVVSGMEATLGIMTPQYEKRLRALDYRAMIAFIDCKHVVSFDGVLPEIQLPCLIYTGTEDSGAYDDLPRIVDELPNAQSFTLPDADHMKVSLMAETVVPKVKVFINKVEQQA